MAASRRPQAQGLLTREERHLLRIALDDLQAQAARTTDPHRRAELAAQIENVEMERRSDRETRPKTKRSKRTGGRRG